ncbi:M20 family metallopeptidase [Paraburkholderia atlantica]|uniref:Peptidase M20 n=1 Tax=Paraburkholderia atlantica TaxID=2654982 RepID=D5WNA3_PARAM|nr:M20 family metallopeptidase [Paraburkholderia atlantica]ADG20782.1 peptidase M20 [Paraburkholderia atlantica]MBB5510066.1 acetylornithine deacetylase/succinyl-diaminopimelate desuccinylase-like protein [Paraburkholderia atlantica]
MTRTEAIAHVSRHFESGAFQSVLRRRVGYRTESQNPASQAVLLGYLSDEIAPALHAMGFTSDIVDNPDAGMPPMLIGERLESVGLPTVLIYGHGDVVNGDATNWTDALSPWELRADGDRWYGRGTADNKGQHSINLAALASVLATRGSLGFNAKVIFEMGEEVGSPGLDSTCARYADRLSADLLIASDGPRQRAAAPTMFLGSRGALHFRLRVSNAFGARHSGNWGGVLANPATVLANALASLVDGSGRIRVNGLLPPPIPQRVRELVANLEVGADEGDPPLSPGWGEPGLSDAERVYAWNTIEVLAMQAGDTCRPVSAIPGSAEAVCQLRFVIGTDWLNARDLLLAHLHREGFDNVDVTIEASGGATRLDPDHPWSRWAEDSIAATSGKPVTILPNLGGTIPNECFATTLGLATIWVPHSYPNCRQHAPDEHLLGSVALESLKIMTGLFWDLGESGHKVRETVRASSKR